MGVVVRRYIHVHVDILIAERISARLIIRDLFS